MNRCQFSSQDIIQSMFHCKVIAAGFVVMMKAFDSNTEPERVPSSVRLPLLQSTEVFFSYFYFLSEFDFHFL